MDIANFEIGLASDFRSVFRQTEHEVETGTRELSRRHVRTASLGAENGQCRIFTKEELFQHRTFKWAYVFHKSTSFWNVERAYSSDAVDHFALHLDTLTSNANTRPKYPCQSLFCDLGLNCALYGGKGSLLRPKFLSKRA